LPFTNSATENKANGASHIVTNNGVAIRTLADYSIPDCPNSAKKAAYFDGSSYLTIPYSDDFDYFGKEPLTYRVWVYMPTLTNRYLFQMYELESDEIIAIFNNGKLTISSYIDGLFYENNNENKNVSAATWTLLEFTFANTREGNGNNYSFVNGIGDIDTNNEAVRITPLNSIFYIGNTFAGNYGFIGYMSEFQIFKGLARPRPGTYNPTNNQRYYTLPTKML